MPVYLDCNATTPIEPEALEIVIRYMRDEYGNSGSRTHEFGAQAKKAVERAREQVAAVVEAEPQEVVFTSGATESNNLAMLGLAEAGRRAGRMHLISTAIEHKAVLEPLDKLAREGFDVSLVPCSSSGRIEPKDIAAALRHDTLLVSVMQVNNETGVIQPIAEIADQLTASDTYYHVDAAQGFGKELDALRNRRIDLISVSGHKIYGPKGVGALIARRRNGFRLPLTPLIYGGGQERGLRPGTAPVPLIAGLGEAARIALRDHATRRAKCLSIRHELRQALRTIDHAVNGDERWIVPSTLNVSIAGVDSEAAMVVLKDLVAISNGSACTSASYNPSHVLEAMGLSKSRCAEALRFSWSHLTAPPSWTRVISRLAALS
jgi:cysteine desulfurase